MLSFSLRCWDQQIVPIRTDTHISRKIHYTNFTLEHARIYHMRWELQKNYLHVLQRHVLMTTALSQHYCNWDMMDSFTAVRGHINRLSPYKQRGKFLLVIQHTTASRSVNTWHVSQLNLYDRSSLQHERSCYSHRFTSKTVKETKQKTCCILRETLTQNRSICWHNNTCCWRLEKSRTRWQTQGHCDNQHT